MSWWPWALDDRVRTLELAVAVIAKKVAKIPIGDDMSKLHDRLKTLVSDLDKSTDTVIANATESETQFQDIVTGLESVIDKLKKKIEDDASGGGSTGGGSGAQTPEPSSQNPGMTPQQATAAVSNQQRPGAQPGR